MISILSTVITLFLSIPILGLFLIFMAVKLISKDTHRSVHMALDCSTILFIISVHFLLKTIWGHSFLGFILLVMVLIAMGFVLVHWKLKGEINFKKVIKGFWRFNFLFFFLAYLSLTLFGLVFRAITFTFST